MFIRIYGKSKTLYTNNTNLNIDLALWVLKGKLEESPCFSIRSGEKILESKQKKISPFYPQGLKNASEKRQKGEWLYFRLTLNKEISPGLGQLQISLTNNQLTGDVSFRQKILVEPSAPEVFSEIIKEGEKRKEVVFKVGKRQLSGITQLPINALSEVGNITSARLETKDVLNISDLARLNPLVYSVNDVEQLDLLDAVTKAKQLTAFAWNSRVLKLLENYNLNQLSLLSI
ncbi:MAG: hypothetical protein MI810_07815, partial [Flavobacteriales bacterium]|nr:hypothetical protein [Flavobacteriales bacterium]